MHSKFYWRHLMAICFGASTLWLFNTQEILAKVGLENFTPAQQQWFWDKVDEMAIFEAFVRFCGRNIHFEQRMVAAAEGCATAEAIQRVRAVFRKKVAAHLKDNKPGICQLPGSPELIIRIEKDLENAIEDVVRACRSCLTC